MADTMQRPPIIPLANLLDGFAAEAAAAYEARQSGAPRGPITGMPQLDVATGGFLSPGLHVVHAEPGVGKTSFVLQIAATCGYPAVYVSAEMSPLELLRRITARVTGTFLGKFKTGELAPADALGLAKTAISKTPQLAILDATRGYASPEWITEAATVCRGDARSVLLVIDSAHSWAAAAPSAVTEYERLNAHLGALVNVAATLNAPILLVAERNRATMSTGGMSAAAGSRSFEYSAETLLELSKDTKQERPDHMGETLITLRVTKNRHGQAGDKLNLKFHGAMQRWREE